MSARVTAGQRDTALRGAAWSAALRQVLVQMDAGTPEPAPAGRCDALPQAGPHAPRCSVTGVSKLSGGASLETWRFDLVEGASSTPLILRRLPVTAAPGGRDAACVSLVTEAALLALAAQAGVPVPRVRLVLQAQHGLGEGFVMQRIEGETLGRQIVRDARFAAARQDLAYACGQTMARIHQIAPKKLPVLREAAAAAQLAHYRSMHRRHATSRPVFELAFQWLQQHAPPAPTHPVLVHGDFRNGNLIVDSCGLRAVLDWELAHLGDGMEDLGWICVNSWRFGQHALPVGGFGKREALFAGYRSAGGTVDATRVHYWQVFGTLKWGIICEGMAHAHLSGAETNIEKAAIGRRASEAEIDLLELLAPGTRVDARAVPVTASV